MSVKRRALAETLAANRTITAAEFDQYEVFRFDCGGAGRTVTLPAEATSGSAAMNQSCIFVNTSDAAEVLTINNDAAGTIATPTQNECAVLMCDGTAWVSYGETT